MREKAKKGPINKLSIIENVFSTSQQWTMEYYKQFYQKLTKKYFKQDIVWSIDML